MASYTRILVAVALGDDHQARQLLEKALSLTSARNIHVVHVEEHPVTGLGDLTGRNHAMNEAQIRQRVFPALRELSDAYGLNSEHLHIVFGDPAPEIHALAQKLPSDLVVIGSHGSRGLKRLFGTTADDIVHSARMDTLMVYTGG